MNGNLHITKCSSHHTLIQKYNVPGPRYTSYPTVPYWEENNFSVPQWINTLQTSFSHSNEAKGISIYIHLPFCESLCTFCGCNKRITKNHSVEKPYIEALKKEWKLYLDLLSTSPYIKEIHLGGGTPTFFNPIHLEDLISYLLKTSFLHPDYEFGFEAHPNNTTENHLQTLYQLGFQRISMGVQEYNPTVQQAIHRIQPYENVKKVTEKAREIGYTSISHDLVFGLPKQKSEHIEDTIQKTITLKPDRIAFYSYAHVPWIKGVGQRGFSEKDLPSGPEKRILYEKGRNMLEQNGYIEIGMDHFALPHDSLYQAFKNKTLHRNFMGYTTTTTDVIIGLGVSAIGDTWLSFAQNEKELEKYYEKLNQSQLPLFRGHLLTPEDKIIRRHILNIMCQFETSWDDPSLYFPEIPEVLARLREPLHDGLITLDNNTLKVTPAGIPFVRNICMAFDLRLHRHQPQQRIFSMTV